MLEAYLRDGTPLPYSDPDPARSRAANIAGAGIHLLPEPQSAGMTLEMGFVMQLPAAPGEMPLHVRGFQDIARSTDAGPEVWDHKTTSNFGYAKSADDLMNNVQALIYAYEAMEAAGSDAVDLNWVYYLTRGTPKSKKVHLRLTREYVTPRILGFRSVLESLLPSLQSKASPLSLPADTTHCSAYGGCPYREVCSPHLTNTERARGVLNMTPQAQDILARLENKSAELQGTKPAPAPAATSDLDDLLAGLVKGPATPPAAPASLPSINPPGEWQPESAADEPVKAAAPTEEKPKRTRRTKEQMAADTNAASKLQHLVEHGVITSEQAATLANTNVTLSEGSPTSGYVTIHIEAAPVPSGSLAPERTLVDIHGPDAGFTLYVDCVPMGASVTYAEEVFQDVKKRILAEHGVADYRFIQFKAAGVFSDTLAKLVAEGGVTGNIVLNAHTPEGQIAMAVLMPAARFPVVRGL